MHEKTRCAAYLIRWQENHDQSGWRAVAVDVYTGQKKQFTDRHVLLHFLWQALRQPGMPGADTAVAQEDE